MPRRGDRDVRGCTGVDADRVILPCRALEARGACPLDGGRVDLAVLVRARPWSRSTPRELGAICAVRDGLPLVVVGAESARPWGRLATVVADEADLVVACEASVARHAADRRRTELDDTVEKARRAFDGGEEALVVFDQSTPVGVVTRRALEAGSPNRPKPDARVEDVMDGEVVELMPSADQATTLRRYRDAAWRSLSRRRPGSKTRAARRAAARGPVAPEE